MNVLVNVMASVAVLIVGSTLVYAGSRKLLDIRGARAAVLDYRIGPPQFAVLTAPVVAFVELFVGLGCIAGIPLGIAGAILVLALFSAVAGLALMRGLEIDCHCGTEGLKLGPATLGRNAVLMASLVPGLLLHSGTLLDPTSLAVPLPFALAEALALASLVAFVSILRLRTPQIVAGT